MLNLRRSPTLKVGNSAAHWQPSPIALQPAIIIIIIMTICIVSSILVVIIVVVTAALPAILVIFK